MDNAPEDHDFGASRDKLLMERHGKLDMFIA